MAGFRCPHGLRKMTVSVFSINEYSVAGGCCCFVLLGEKRDLWRNESSEGGWEEKTSKMEEMTPTNGFKLQELLGYATWVSARYWAVFQWHGDMSGRRKRILMRSFGGGSPMSRDSAMGGRKLLVEA